MSVFEARLPMTYLAQVEVNDHERTNRCMATSQPKKSAQPSRLSLVRPVFKEFLSWGASRTSALVLFFFFVVLVSENEAAKSLSSIYKGLFFHNQMPKPHTHTNTDTPRKNPVWDFLDLHPNAEHEGVIFPPQSNCCSRCRAFL